MRLLQGLQVELAGSYAQVAQRPDGILRAIARQSLRLSLDVHEIACALLHHAPLIHTEADGRSTHSWPAEPPWQAFLDGA